MKLPSHLVRLYVSSLCMLLVACQMGKEYPPSVGHLGVEPDQIVAEADIPAVIKQTPYLPKPAIKQLKQDTYTVVVNDVPVRELLFALARDAKLNLDIFDDIKGQISINAIDQTLPKILDRIGKQSNIRYQIQTDVLEVSADSAYLKTYTVPYLNMSRQSRGAVSLSVELGASGAEGDQEGVARTNNSSASIANTSNNQFWLELENNLRGILSAPAKSGSDSDTSSNIIVNSSAGLVTVRASQRQHRDIAEYLDRVIDSVRR